VQPYAVGVDANPVRYEESSSYGDAVEVGVKVVLAEFPRLGDEVRAQLLLLD
jgi:hypothetical protein